MGKISEYLTKEDTQKITMHMKICSAMCTIKGFLMAQWVKNLPAMQETQETQVRSLGREGLLEEEMTTHSSIHAWEIPWTEEPGGLQSVGLQKVGHNWATKQQQIYCLPHTWPLAEH